MSGPIFGCQLSCARDHSIRIPPRDQNSGGVAGFVGPGETDPHVRIKHAVLLDRGDHSPKHGLAGFHNGRRPLTGEEHRHTHPRFDRALTAADELHEVADAAFAGVPAINVRCLAVRGREINQRRKLAGEIAVRIHRHRQHALRADDVTHGAHKVLFRVFAAEHRHGAVHVQVHTVERAVVREPTHDLPEEEVIGGRVDGASGVHRGDEARDKLDVGQVGETLVPVVHLEDFVTTDEAETLKR